MLVGEVTVGMRLKSRYTYGLPVVVTRLIHDPDTGVVTGFNYSHEETFSRHFRPGSGKWLYPEMLNWEQLDPTHPQIGLTL